ncbi:MAG: esterase family protein [Bacteroidales bacterium]|jgi:enterochelin esterase-like enzyme|nr:esterase family protein [Bacteroidales bacterium]
MIVKNKITLIAALCFVSFFSCNCNEEKPISPDNFARYTTDLQINSKILGMSIKYSVFLPADYVKNPNKHYPVVYLLHGLGDDHKSWNDQWLNIAARIENWENTAGLEPMIYIMPQGFRSYYVNRYDGKFNYMDMFVEELVPEIDRIYRTVADREHRAVVGYSMGGFGAMILASKHPEIFSVSVPLSMSFRTDEQYMTESASGWDNQWGAIFGGKGLTGAARLTDYYRQHCPFYMFTPQTVQQYSSIKYFIDCGDDEEQLLVSNDKLHVLMRDIGLYHEYRVRDGAHTSSYWANAMQEALPYISACFNGVPYKTEESVTLPDTLNMTWKDTVLQGVSATVFFPVEYNLEVNYPIVYLIKNNAVSAVEAAKALQKNKPFVLVVSDMSDNKTPLYLLDVAIDTTDLISTNFYYISLGDDGENYKNADALYRICHKQNIPFEYRVYNGTSSKNSILYGLLQMREMIK